MNTESRNNTLLGDLAVLAQAAVESVQVESVPVVPVAAVPVAAVPTEQSQQHKKKCADLSRWYEIRAKELVFSADDEKEIEALLSGFATNSPRVDWYTVTRELEENTWFSVFCFKGILLEKLFAAETTALYAQKANSKMESTILLGDVKLPVTVIKRSDEDNSRMHIVIIPDNKDDIGRVYDQVALLVRVRAPRFKARAKQSDGRVFFKNLRLVNMFKTTQAHALEVWREKQLKLDNLEGPATIGVKVRTCTASEIETYKLNDNSSAKRATKRLEISSGVSVEEVDEPTVDAEDDELTEDEGDKPLAGLKRKPEQRLKLNDGSAKRATKPLKFSSVADWLTWDDESGDPLPHEVVEMHEGDQLLASLKQMSEELYESLRTCHHTAAGLWKGYQCEAGKAEILRASIATVNAKINDRLEVLNQPINLD